MTQKTASDSEIFREAAKLPADRRSAYLDDACGDNAALRDEVESLLRVHNPDDSFLQAPAMDPGALGTPPMGPTAEMPIREAAGSTIGPYKLREKIGQGGFGVVYVAEQEAPVRRKVALKIIKPGMDTREVIARFEAEQQALAMMDHPNVARVLDAGATSSGLPYFVMELVQGVTITEFCDKNNLPTRERLQLFADVCRAVQHAHQKGIIHRDIKPSNIMVTLHDGKPVVKVIDFGISKALNQQLTEKSIYTAYGQMIGTPTYMSPEQAEMSGLGIDTRSDIYSLGVLLYELLTGETPLDAKRLRSSANAEVLRIIREEEPQRPSHKVSTLGEKATIAAKHRHTDPQQLRRDLTGELDWIVMKCLEKERGRRYDTANGLARDVERFLADEAVEACPPSFRYRLRKTIRRNRGPVLAASLVFAALCIGMVGTTFGLLRANSESERARKSEERALAQAVKAEKAAAAELAQRKRADSEAAASKAVRNFLQEDLLRGSSWVHQAESISPVGDGGQILLEPTVKQLLDRAATELAPQKIDAKFGKDRFVQAEVLKAVGDAYVSLRPSDALEPLNRAIKLYEAELGPDHPTALSARHSLGVALFEQAVMLALPDAQRRNEAVNYLEGVLDARIRILGPWDKDTLATRDYFGRALLDADPQRAMTYFQRLSEDAGLQLGAKHAEFIKARFHLAMALGASGKREEGLAILEGLMAEMDAANIRRDHPYFLVGQSTLAIMYEQAKKPDQAIARLKFALKQTEATVGQADPIRMTLQHLLGWVCLRAGRIEEAIAAFEQNLLEKELPGPRRAMQLAALAKALESKDLPRSLDLFEQARLMRIEHREGQHIFYQRYALRNALEYVKVLQKAGRHQDAIERLDEIIQFVTDNPQVTEVKLSEASSLRMKSVSEVGK